MSMGLFTVYQAVGFRFSIFLTKAGQSFITFITLARASRSMRSVVPWLESFRRNQR
jgi:hypothetical protein